MTLEDLVGQTLYFTFPSQGIQPKKVRKIQFTERTKEWFFEANSTYRVSEIGKTIFFSEEEAIKYQHFIMEQYTKEQQEKNLLREKRQREADLKNLERLINKYADDIVIKVDHYVSGKIDSGAIGHRKDYADYEDIEGIRRDDKNRIEITVCICD